MENLTKYLFNMDAKKLTITEISNKLKLEQDKIIEFLNNIENLADFPILIEYQYFKDNKNISDEQFIATDYLVNPQGITRVPHIIINKKYLSPEDKMNIFVDEQIFGKSINWKVSKRGYFEWISNSLFEVIPDYVKDLNSLNEITQILPYVNISYEFNKKWFVQFQEDQRSISSENDTLNLAIIETLKLFLDSKERKERFQYIVYFSNKKYAKCSPMFKNEGELKLWKEDFLEKEHKYGEKFLFEFRKV